MDFNRSPSSASAMPVRQRLLHYGVNPYHRGHFVELAWSISSIPATHREHVRRFTDQSYRYKYSRPRAAVHPPARISAGFEGTGVPELLARAQRACSGGGSSRCAGSSRPIRSSSADSGPTDPSPACSSSAAAGPSCRCSASADDPADKPAIYGRSRRRGAILKIWSGTIVLSLWPRCAAMSIAERPRLGRIAARRLCAERMAGSGGSCRTKPDRRSTHLGRTGPESSHAAFHQSSQLSNLNERRLSGSRS